MGFSVATLNTIRVNASDEYQQRIPTATINNILSIGQAFSAYTNVYNEFCDVLLHKIGKTIIESKLFTNKLARFKMGAILTQQDVEEIFIQMSQAESAYIPAGTNALGRRSPSNVKAYYHRMNRQDQYCISIGDIDFLRAFSSESSLDSFISKQINSVYSGANYDEWLMFKNLLASFGHTPDFDVTADVALVANKAYYLRTGSAGAYVYTPVATADLDVADIATYYDDQSTAWGYFDYTTVDVTTEATAKDFVKNVRKASQDASFVNTTFNLAGVKTYSDPADMVLLVNKDALVECDVEMLSRAFHKGDTDLSNVPTIITMDDFGQLPATFGLLVDKDFFRVWDTLSRMETQRNAQGLFTNYFYHVHQIMSASPFKTAIRFVKGT